jgi:uncharacterized protein (DUF1499 family)
MQRLEAVVSSLPRTRVVERRGDYLRAEASSRLFGFIDDVEFQLDEPARVIHVRSAARVGYRDFGVNRARIEKVRAAFASAQGGRPLGSGASSVP